MKFRNKNDIDRWLNNFPYYAQFDGNKHYFVFNDRKRGGTWTLMFYNDSYTVHGKGEDYCDPEETPLTRKEVLTFIWKNRGSIHITHRDKAL